MPAAFPGNSTTKLARSDGAGGFESAIEEVVSGTPAINSVTDNGDGTLTITGSNFGTKAQAAPVLLDDVDVAYENGTGNNFVGSLSDGATVPDNAANASSPYNTVTSLVTVNKTAERYAGAGSCYEVIGNEGWIGWPMAYGGQNTPAGNEKMYLSFWLERKWKWYYWRIAPVSAVTDSFIPGEDVTLSGIADTGRFIDIETVVGDTDLWHFEMPRRTSTALKGRTITGVTSGATMIFPDDGRGGSGLGFEPPGTKYVRFRDDPGDSALRGIQTPQDVWIFQDGELTGTGYSRVQDPLDEETPDVSHLHEIEVYIDDAVGEGISRSWFDGRFRGEQWFRSDARDMTKSLVFSLLGNDAFETFQRTRIHQVYFDSTPQRVMIGNASTKDSCTSMELQKLESWAPESINITERAGGLSGTAWVYVVGPDGSVNDQGYEVQL